MAATTRSVTEIALVGSLLGEALGDAIGLPYEGLSRRRGVRLLGEPDRHRFAFRRGMISDDTEHACLVAQALIVAGTDAEVFSRELARGLRSWFLCLPAGIGMATLRACLKLCVGVPPSRSGVFSAGNGPAMRAPILGAAIDNLDQLWEFVRRSTRITHTDPKAQFGAWTIALATHHAARVTPVDPQKYWDDLRETLSGQRADEFLAVVERAFVSYRNGEATGPFAESLGLVRGVTGYVNHTVPMVLHAWWRHSTDFREAIRSLVLCGGDTDTTAAILGGIIGAGVGPSGLPADWIRGLMDWPRTTEWIIKLGTDLFRSRTDGPTQPPRCGVFSVLARNTVFTTIVLAHGSRRLFPPY